MHKRAQYTVRNVDLYKYNIYNLHSNANLVTKIQGKKKAKSPKNKH